MARMKKLFRDMPEQHMRRGQCPGELWHDSSELKTHALSRIIDSGLSQLTTVMKDFEQRWVIRRQGERWM